MTLVQRTLLENEEGATSLGLSSTASNRARLTLTGKRRQPKRLGSGYVYTRATLNFIFIIPLYPHTPVCKPGRTLKQILSGLLEFWKTFSLRGWIGTRTPTIDLLGCFMLGVGMCLFLPRESEAL